MKGFFNLQRFAVIKGSSGHDYLSTEVENTVVYGYGGNDTLSNIFNNVTLVGADGTDSIKSGHRFNGWESSSHSWGWHETVTSGNSISGGTGNDYIYANIMQSTVNGDDGNDIIYSEYNGYNGRNLLSGGEGHDSINNNGVINTTLIGGNGKDTLYNSGQGSTLLGGNSNDELGNDAAYAYLNGGDNNDAIWTHSGDGVTMTGGAGDDVIWSHKNNSGSVTGGSGNDTIYGLENTINITLAGGTGNDMVSLTSGVTAEIQYTAGDGNDTIYGFDENDILYIAGSKFSTTKSDDNSLVVKVGSNKIVINNAADKSLDIEKVSSFPSDGDYSGGLNETELTAGKNFTGKEIDLTDHPTVEKLNMSAVSQALTIVGNKLNNSIRGGKGNDTISGGAGKDVFAYANGDGKDVITDYTTGQDKIQITSGKISKSKVKGKNVIFTVGKGTITIKNGKGKKISVINADGTTSTYKNSKKLKTSALLAENNFAATDNLSEIVENKLSATDYKLSTQNFETLSQENLITFAEK